MAACPRHWYKLCDPCIYTSSDLVKPPTCKVRALEYQRSTTELLKNICDQLTFKHDHVRRTESAHCG